MNVPTRFVEPFTPEQVELVKPFWKQADRHRPRNRTLAILLSHKRYTSTRIADLCSVTRDTVGRWLHSWQDKHENGFEDTPRSGAPRRFEPAEQEQIFELLECYPNQPKQVQAHSHEETGKERTADILARLAHEASFP